jgi:tRNA nucleotidyltransferase/poly(A) polymerase
LIIQHFKNYEEPLEGLLALSKRYNIDRPFAVGGSVRNYLLNYPDDGSDLDITTNSSECIRLGVLLSTESSQVFRMFSDRHIRVFYKGKNIDFSPGILSNAHPGVISWLRQNLPDREKYSESFSRDFTINSLHQDVESGEIIDPSGSGVKDIESKIIRTILPPDITIKNDPRRIFRAIKLASKFKLSIDSSLIEYVRENSEIIMDEKLTTQYMTNEINEALRFDQDLAMSNIFDFGLFKIIPLSGLYSEYLIKNKLLSKYLS